ncbi:MAG: MerR family transcriptional regulator [Bacteroidetes bacterium]|nr:MerR family transcriptional regulator [Bacteroidota bacterium]MBS1926412.1 MerR family transcriptional regulator [Bacteroidota bacterium]MCC6693467.1 MerR family transcriptional regulator [Chitinophagaceae bacterium]
MALTADLVEVPEDEILFSKQYYSIGAVAEMFKANVSLLRFWEKEFDILKPRKNGKGDRLFRPEDIKNLKMIHHLLRQKKFTIDGAKEFIKKNKQAEENYAVIETLQKLKTFLNELKANL